jgi:catecholate siderophore receptor
MRRNCDKTPLGSGVRTGVLKLMTKNSVLPSPRRLRPSSCLIGASLGLLLAPGLGYAADSAAAPSGGVAEVEAITVMGARDDIRNHTTGLAASVSTSVRDTPQVVNVVSQDLLQQQKVTTLEQALRDVPGITVAIGEGGTLAGDQFKIRGLDANNDIYTDGLRDFGVYTRDSFDYQEVQVLKGPSGAMFGRGTTGGAINTLSKKPSTVRDFTALDASIGMGPSYRGAADINHRMNDTTAIRLNLMGTRAGVVRRDKVHSDRYGVALSAGVGLGTRTSFVVNVLHQQDDRIPDYGLIIGAPSGQIKALPAPEYGLSPKVFEQFTNDRDKTRADILTAGFRWDAGPDWTVASDTRFGSYDRYFQYTSVVACAVQTSGQTCIDALIDNDPATIPYITFGGGGPYKQRAWGAQNITSARGTFRVGGFRNEMVGGLDVNHQDNRKAFYAYTLPPLSSAAYLPGTKAAARNAIAINLLTGAGEPRPDYQPFRPAPTPSVAATGIPGTSITSASYVIDSAGFATDYAGFLTDRLYLSPRLSVIGAVRYDDFAAWYSNLLISGARQTFKTRSRLTSPRVSGVFEASDRQTYYVSWGRSATPVGSGIVGTATPVSGTTAAFAPDIGETLEAGAKFGLLHDRLGLNGAVFHVRKDNAKQTDPTTGEVSSQSSQKQTFDGVEIGLAGEVTRGWTINAGYTYLATKVTEDLTCAGAPLVCVANRVTTGTPVLQVPANSAYVWTSYKLSAVLPGLAVGGGIIYQDGYPVRYTTTGAGAGLVLTRDAQVPDTVSLDGMIQYEGQGWRVAVNAYNLTDRINYGQSFGNRAAPSAGRTVVLSFGKTF